MRQIVSFEYINLLHSNYVQLNVTIMLSVLFSSEWSYNVTHFPQIPLLSLIYLLC